MDRGPARRERNDAPRGPAAEGREPGGASERPRPTARLCRRRQQRPRRGCVRALRRRRAAGAAAAVVERLRNAVESTGTKGFGAFAGLYPLDARTLLAASMDSIGTKPIVARPRGALRNCGADMA